jgi:uncharacterized coiled-coil DUF342 family protein
MEPEQKEAAKLGIPNEMHEQAKEIIERAFQFFREHFGSFSQEIADFDKRHQETKEEIRRGARRTNGRIV